MRDDASTTASARRSSSRRNSIAATHGVIAPRVGRAGGGGGGGGSGGGGRAWRGGGVKTKAAIDRDASPLEPYDANSLPRGRDNEAAKDALAATMEWGETTSARARVAAAVRREKEKEATEARRRAAAAGAADASKITADDMVDAIAREIDERWAFLREMDAAGLGERHRGVITAEISARVNQLKRLDAMLCERDGVPIRGAASAAAARRRPGPGPDPSDGAPPSGEVGGMYERALERMRAARS